MPRKTVISGSASRPWFCFNEAAARCRGKRSDAFAPMPGL